MKAINYLEVSKLAQGLQELLGAPLQDVLTAEDILVCGFWRSPKVHWVAFYMNSASPLVLIGPEKGDFSKLNPKPMALFLKKHGVGKVLESVNQDSPRGRTLRMKLGELEIEVCLIPHAQNIVAVTPDARISWNKPKSPPPQNLDFTPENVRTPADILHEWRLSKKQGGIKKGPEEIRKALERKLQQKTDAAQKLKEDIKAKESQRWREFGDFLKESGPGDKVPVSWAEYHDASLSFSQNLQRAYEKAKLLEKKLESSFERLKLLEGEIELVKIEIAKSDDELLALERSQRKPAAATPLKDLPKNSSKEKLRVRTITIDDSLILYIGKSAKDNLGLLRQSQSWDYWLHLRDYPGCHAILRRPRHSEVPRHVIDACARHVVENSVRGELGQGDRFDVIICEKRFVTPIKGDKLGRVTCKNERTFTVVF